MSKTSRRDFIKSKLFGGLLLASSVPFYSLVRPKNKNEIISSLPVINDGINWKDIQEHFQIKEGNYFFNTASLGSSPKIVIDRICESLKYNDTIPREGYQERKRVRQKLSTFLNAKPKEVAITRNATEGMNIVARSLQLKKGDEVIISTHEHIGGSAPWIALQKEVGINIKLVDLDLEGKDNFQRIKDSITSKTKVVSISHLTCTTGMILPMSEIVELCRKNKIYSCIDGAQAIGMIPLDLSSLKPDFYVGSGHKWLFGPKGTGFLYINETVIQDCSPTFVGAFSDSQFDLNSLTLEYLQKASRSEYGTRNTSIMLGLESAVDFATSIGIESIYNRSKQLAKRFKIGVNSIKNLEIISPTDQAYSSAIVTFKVKGFDSNLLVDQLNKDKSIRLRKVYENKLNAIRASFAIFNSEEDVDYLIASINDLLSK